MIVLLTFADKRLAPTLDRIKQEAIESRYFNKVVLATDETLKAYADTKGLPAKIITEIGHTEVFTMPISEALVIGFGNHI